MCNYNMPIYPVRHSTVWYTVLYTVTVDMGACWLLLCLSLFSSCSLLLPGKPTRDRDCSTVLYTYHSRRRKKVIDTNTHSCCLLPMRPLKVLREREREDMVYSMQY